MERLTGRYDGQAILICENEKCDKFDEIVCCSEAQPCEAEQNMIDRLAAYEDAEEQGLLVRVVRCKDCKYGVPTKNGFRNDMIACENKDSPCGYSSWLCQLDWFCADGERREGKDG